MRNLSDTGLSPNNRFSKSTKKNAIILSNGDIVRIVSDYDKILKVKNIMIRIQDKINCDRIMFYTIADPILASKLNQCWVRVRMVKSKPDYIYLFEQKTDTYLGCVPRDLEPAGDLANKTTQDWKSHNDFNDLKKAHKQYRQEHYKQVLNDIEQADANFEKSALPADASATAGLIIAGEVEKSEFSGDEEVESVVNMPEEKEGAKSLPESAGPTIGELDVVTIETLSVAKFEDEELEMA